MQENFNTKRYNIYYVFFKVARDGYMTRKQQKDKEEVYLNLFIERIFDLKNNKIGIENTEQPDFIIHANNKKIGIEITNLFHKNGNENSSEQIQMAKRKNVLEIAQKNFLKRNINTYEFNFNFDSNYPIHNVTRAASKLSDSIEKFLKEEINKQKVSEMFTLDACPEILNIHSNFKKYHDPKWNLVQVYDVPNIDISNLSFLINQKKEKLNNYKVCDEQWLLIIIEFWDPAQDQHFSLKGGEFIASPFDKIIIFKPATLDLIEYF